MAVDQTKDATSGGARPPGQRRGQGAGLDGGGDAAREAGGDVGRGAGADVGRGRGPVRGQDLSRGQDVVREPAHDAGRQPGAASASTHSAADPEPAAPAPTGTKPSSPHSPTSPSRAGASGTGASGAGASRTGAPSPDPSRTSASRTGGSPTGASRGGAGSGGGTGSGGGAGSGGAPGSGRGGVGRAVPRPTYPPPPPVPPIAPPAGRPGRAHSGRSTSPPAPRPAPEPAQPAQSPRSAHPPRPGTTGGPPRAGADHEAQAVHAETLPVRSVHPTAPRPAVPRPAVPGTTPAPTAAPAPRAPSSHADCGCPQGAREAHRRAVAEFAALRDRLAAGQGLPAALAHSAGASRQWVSDELTQAARAVAERGREASEAWLSQVWRRMVAVVWAAVGALLITQLVTALAANGWTVARTAALLAALGTGVLLTAAAWLHRARGGLLAPLIGEDNRLSTSRTVAAGWVLFAGYTVLMLTVERVARADGPPSGGLGLGRSAAALTVLGLSCAVAVLARLVVANRVRAQRAQKVRAERPRPADLLTDDAGRGSFTEAQYVLLNAAVAVFACVTLAREPHRLPALPWGIAVLVAVSAVTCLAGKYAEAGRPTVLSVVRVREAGDLDGPIRIGDDIEIRGSGFVPPGALDPDRLTRTVVRIGTVHVHVPLVPVAGGFTNPADTVLTVPVPAEVEPGRADVQVITASGAESNRYPIDVLD